MKFKIEAITLNFGKNKEIESVEVNYGGKVKLAAEQYLENPTLRDVAHIVQDNLVDHFNGDDDSDSESNIENESNTDITGNSNNDIASNEGESVDNSDVYPEELPHRFDGEYEENREEEPNQEQNANQPSSIGGGWYELPTGEKVQGEENAYRKFREWRARNPIRKMSNEEVDAQNQAQSINQANTENPNVRLNK